MNSACSEPVVLAPTARKKFSVCLASSNEEVVQCQRLRYQIFAEEMGADLSSDIPGLERDRFDDYCHHLLVRDERNGQVIATTRLLTRENAVRAGMYYSETEFDLTPILGLSGHIMEVGRTCIHRDYRNGSALPLLWQGVAQIAVGHHIDYLIGCASIPLDSGDSYVASVMSYLESHHSAPAQLCVTPKKPLPKKPIATSNNVILPTLLKAYLRQGAIICGDAYLDKDFNVADVFVLLEKDRLAERYVRHFINRD